ncbi:hypothetical protein CABS01_11804 [Colletotrichum abscissum]|uniref:Oxidoreductase AflY n=1 Tax=Colletotrichum abscissum TaxID=1671311 RepID=A0A9P9XBB5_9PEZI|nr:uncharacterized protein CABS01_11804 [Colletotrichum abscissum]KAI3545142.1 hypothetical protein CABS02_09485 [Colletotrichum abscissum]KAK1492907.1 hypothetical protein CABS01_11804 [Colletotrichum abscissum]
MASQIALSSEHAGILCDADVSSDALNEANNLLQANHDKWHIFFRDVTGHNHTAHSILTCLALGADSSDLQRAYDDTVDIQRTKPDMNAKVLQQLNKDEENLGELLGTCDLYSTFLAFFEGEINKHGWKQVVNRFVFSRTPLAEKMLIKMYEGMYHSLIHLGLGVEWEQPGIIAEALAQAATHEDGHIGALLFSSEIMAKGQPHPEKSLSLLGLSQQVQNNKAIFTAPKWEDRWNRMRNGVMDDAASELAPIAAQFRIRSVDLERRTAEMISFSAYLAGASQRPAKKCKIDFFLMHVVTSSIFFTIFNKQDWIAMEDRLRLVEWKGRLDLAFYAFCRCPDLHSEAITEYYDEFTKDMDWKQLYAAVTKEHDDGHVAKFIRALRNGEESAKAHEGGAWSANFPVKGDMWLKLARMSLGSTRGVTAELKWIMGTGFDEAWSRPDLK